MDLTRLNKLIEQTMTLEKETFVPELNDNFKRWFGDSKVVDDNGQPLVCYHGSTVDIEEFDLGYSGQTTGNNQEEVFYFTSDKDTAITYSQEATVRENEWKFWDEEEKKNIEFEDYDDYAEYLREQIFENPHINPCYLKMENPFVFDADYTIFDAKRNYTLCSMLKGNNNIDYDMWDYNLADDLMSVFTEYDEEMDEYIPKENNYDGIIIKNVMDNISEFNQDYVDVYIVWDPYQIKSVYNKGIWDMNNANVHEQIMDEKFEKLQNDLFSTESAYDVLNLMKNKPAPYRVIYDKTNKMYFIGNAFDYIHQDLMEVAIQNGFYPDLFAPDEADDYIEDGLFNGDLLLFSFDPEGGGLIDSEKSSDGYTHKYIYDFGSIYTHEVCNLEDYPIFEILGQPIKKEHVYENFKELNEALIKFLN